MPLHPDSDPPGATPVLPAPGGRRAEQASAAFARFGSGATGPQAEPTASSSSPAPRSGRVLRQYPVALSKLAAEDRSGAIFAGADVADFAAAPAAAETVEIVAEPGLAERPPPGVPVVRPSVRAAEAAGELPALPEDAAGAAMFIAQPDGSSAFEVSLEVETLGPLRCQIVVAEDGVHATFFAGDVNLRRLLEAEAPRLRNALEARGLAVQAVRVAIEEPA